MSATCHSHCPRNEYSVPSSAVDLNEYARRPPSKRRRAHVAPTACHRAVGNVLGLLHDRDPRLAKVEAARGAGAEPLVEPLFDERLLQLLGQLLRALLGARALGIALVSAVHANEEVALAV